MQTKNYKSAVSLWTHFGKIYLLSTKEKRVLIATLLEGEVCNIDREDNQKTVTFEEYVIDIEWDYGKGA